MVHSRNLQKNEKLLKYFMELRNNTLYKLGSRHHILTYSRILSTYKNLATFSMQ